MVRMTTPFPKEGTVTYAEISEKQGRLHNQMTAILKKASDENRVLNAEENVQFDAMDAEIVQLSAQKDRLAKSDAHAKTLNALQPVAMENIGTNAVQADGGRKKHADAYSKAFYKMLKVGVTAMSGEEQAVLNLGFDPQAALTPATGVGGGYTVPQGFEDQLTEAMKWYGGIQQFADTITTDSGNPLPFPTANDTTNIGEIIGPNTQVTQAYPNFGQVMFNAYIFSSKLMLVPLALLQDSAFDFDTWLPKQLGVRIARIQNNKFTVGVGGGVEPTGLVTAAAAAGNVVTMANGNVATISSDNLYDLEGAVDKAYRPGAKYMFSDTTLRLLKKLKDSTGRPLWQPGLSSTFAQGVPDSINGYEYVINNDMPNPGASNYLMAFGDYMNFKIRRVKGYTTMRLTERYADYLQVGFLCAERADSNLVDAGTHPVALLQNSAT